MDLNIVKFIQKASCDFLDGVFSVITVMGETSMLFMMFAAIYLCYRKDFAVKYLFYFMLSGVVNMGVKGVFDRPRPYTQSGVLDVRHTTGHSFPSGHSQNIAIQSTMIGKEYCKIDKQFKHRLWVIIALAVVCVLVGLSRIYLGQHYLTDVLVGLVLGFGLVFVFDMLLKLVPAKIKKFVSVRALLLILLIPVMIAIAVIEYGEIGSEHLLVTFYTYLAIYLGTLIGYSIDKTYIKYKESAVWYVQVIKIAITCMGVALLTLVFRGISSELVKSFSFYFAATLYVTGVLPFVFNYMFKEKVTQNGELSGNKENIDLVNNENNN